MKRDFARTIRGALIPVGLLSLLTACASVEGAPTFEHPPAPVVVSTAVERDVPVYLEQIGKCAAVEIVSIRPQVSGRVTQIHFRDGAFVKRGQRLFTIDPRPYLAQLHSAQANAARERSLLRQAEAAVAQRTADANQARANLARDQAQRDNARTQLARYDELIKQEVVSPDDHDRVRTNRATLEATVRADRAAVETTRAAIAAARAAVDSCKAAIRAAEAAMENARLQLDYTVIRSPIHGRAGQRLVDLGNVVNAASPADMLVIQRLDPIYADFTIPETDLTAVQRSMAQGRARVEVRLPEDTGSPRKGLLTFLDNSVQEGTGTVKLRATLANADQHFWPGRLVQVRLILRTQKGAVLVPVVAPQESAKGTFVYVVKADSTAELRPVQLGPRYEDLVAVARGVRAGERVVVTGQLAVMPGGKVRVGDGKTQAPAAAGAPGGPRRSGAKP